MSGWERPPPRVSNPKWRKFFFSEKHAPLLYGSSSLLGLIVCLRLPLPMESVNAMKMHECSHHLFNSAPPF